MDGYLGVRGLVTAFFFFASSKRQVARPLREDGYFGVRGLVTAFLFFASSTRQVARPLREDGYFGVRRLVTAFFFFAPSTRQVAHPLREDGYGCDGARSKGHPPEPGGPHWTGHTGRATLSAIIEELLADREQVVDNGLQFLGRDPRGFDDASHVLGNRFDLLCRHTSALQDGGHILNQQQAFGIADLSVIQSYAKIVCQCDDRDRVRRLSAICHGTQVLT